MYNTILTTKQLIELFKTFKFTRVPQELHIHHTWKPTFHSFNVTKERRGLPGAYNTLNDSMRNSHIKTFGTNEIAQHLTLFPDGMWAVGRDWNRNPISISGRNLLGFAIEMIGNFDIEGLRTSSVNVLGYDTFEGSETQKAIYEFVKFFNAFYGYDPNVATVFHTEHSTKTCPGNSITKQKFMEDIYPPLKRDPDVLNMFEVVNTPTLNVRDKAGTTGTKIITSLREGDIITSTQVQRVGSIDWHLCKQGWVSGFYLKPHIPVPPYSERFIINIATLNIRDIAGVTGSKIVGNYTLNTVIKATDKTQVGNTMWYKTEKGWISGAYLISYLEPEKQEVVSFENVTKGDRGDTVVQVQHHLIRHGQPIVPDGRFGPATELAVKTFQRLNHITQTGIVDLTTWDLLKK
jgi:hypothetical protein